MNSHIDIIINLADKYDYAAYVEQAKESRFENAKVYEQAVTAMFAIVEQYHCSPHEAYRMYLESLITNQLPTAPAKPCGSCGEMPTIMAQAESLFTETSKWLLGGARLATAEEQQMRLNICAKCDDLAGNRCRICGCFVAVKAKMVNIHCPSERW